MGTSYHTLIQKIEGGRNLDDSLFSFKVDSLHCSNIRDEACRHKKNPYDSSRESKIGLTNKYLLRGMTVIASRNAYIIPYLTQKEYESDEVFKKYLE